MNTLVSAIAGCVGGITLKIMEGELPTHAKGDGMGFGFHRACFVAKV